MMIIVMAIVKINRKKKIKKKIKRLVEFYNKFSKDHSRDGNVKIIGEKLQKRKRLGFNIFHLNSRRLSMSWMKKKVKLSLGLRKVIQ